MAFSEPKSWAEEALLAADLNLYGRDNLNFLKAPPRCRARGTADQSIATGTWVTINLPTEDLDTDGMHDNVTNNPRITIVTAGTYYVGGSILFALNATGKRLCRLRLNGDDAKIIVEGNQFSGQASVDNGVSAAKPWSFAANDYFELQGWQDSGGALNSRVFSPSQPVLWAVWKAA